MYWTRCVLSKFEGSKLTLNHVILCSESVEISFLKSMGLGLVTITLSSFANKIGLGLLLIIFGK
jgi:hypothetical protein